MSPSAPRTAHLLAPVGADHESDRRRYGRAALLAFTEDDLDFLLELLLKLGRGEGLGAEMEYVGPSRSFNALTLRRPRGEQQQAGSGNSGFDQQLAATCWRRLQQLRNDEVLLVEHDAAEWLRQQESLHKTEVGLRAEIGSWAVQLYPSRGTLRETRTAYLGISDLLGAATRAFAPEKAARSWRELRERTSRFALEVAFSDETIALGKPEPNTHRAFLQAIEGTLSVWFFDGEALIEPGLSPELRARALSLLDIDRAVERLRNLLRERPKPALEILDALEGGIRRRFSKEDLTEALRHHDLEVRRGALRFLSRLNGTRATIR